MLSLPAAAFVTLNPDSVCSKTFLMRGVNLIGESARVALYLPDSDVTTTAVLLGNW